MTGLQATDGVSQSTLRIVVVTRYQLDGDALTALFNSQVGFRVLTATTNVEVALVVCQHRHPDAVLLEATLIGEENCPSIQAFDQQIGRIPILLLDNDANHARLGMILDVAHIGYFTRCSPFQELAEGTRRLVCGERAFDTAVQKFVCRTPDGWRLDQALYDDPLAHLTARELEVFRLIASGKSVKDCATVLHLAPSTVDNHKARLMKKLGIHKSLDLTRLAIREGLICL